MKGMSPRIFSRYTLKDSILYPIESVAEKVTPGKFTKKEGIAL